MVVMLGAGSLAPVLGVANLAAPFSPPWAPEQPAQLDLFGAVAVEYVSPSAIETATEELGGCLRKWAWVKLDRVAKTSGKAAELGSATHAQHERYLEHGTPYDLTTRAGELAIATLHLLPAPGVAQVEQEFRVQVATLGPDAWLGGKVDANWAEPPGALGRRQIVLDHKTTGDLAWAKLTREELLHHPQAPIYTSFWWTSGVRQVRVKNSKEWRAWDPGFVPNDIELRWNYVTTKGKPKAVPSWHVVEPGEVWEAFSRYVAPGAKRLLAVVQEANETRKSGKPFGAMQLPANPSACGAFGGCQFRDRCGVSPLEGVRAMADQSLAFLSRMGLAAVPGGQPAGLPTAPPAVVAPPPPPAAPAWTPPAAASVAAATTAPGYGAQINPPESAPAVQQQAATIAAETAAAAAAATPPATETAPARAKGPGRPKKDKAAPATSSDLRDQAESALVESVNVFGEALSLHDQALIAVLPNAFEACKAAIFAGTAAPSSALELAKAVVAPLAEAK